MWLTKNDLPDVIKTGTNSYRIKTDFRSWIMFENIMIDAGIKDRFKPYFMLDKIMTEQYDNNDIEHILNALFLFYRMEKPVKQTRQKSSILGYRYDYDMDLILAAFMQQYGVNLLTTNMHWWEYKSLFDGLTDKTKFIQVVGYRTADTSKMDKEQKMKYEELKAFYALPLENAQERTQEDIEKELLDKLGGEQHEQK